MPAHAPGKSESSDLAAELDAKQAAALLGVKLPTLYAYVSRGLLRSAPGPVGSGRPVSVWDVLAPAPE